MLITANKLNDDSLIIDRMENNMREKLAYIPAKHPNMSVKDINDILVVNSNLPSDTFNTSFGGTISEEYAKKVFDYYLQKKFPMAWWVGPSSQNSCTESILKSVGFEHDEEDVGMKADLTQLKDFIYPEELTIQECKSNADFCAFGEVLSSIFAPYPEEEQVRRYYQMINKVSSENRNSLKLYVGYVNGKPVSTSGLFLTDCAGIFDISTRPEERGKGYGTALFYYALAKAKELGFEVSVLQASPDGLNIYKRFGFSEIGNFNVWSNAHAIHD